jgi:hypothetical protein
MMRSGTPPRKVGWGEGSDVDFPTPSSPTNATVYSSSHLAALTATTATRGPMTVRPLPPSEVPTLLTTIRPSESSHCRESTDARRSSALTRLSSTLSASLIPSSQTRSTYLQVLFAAVVCICLLWTVWLILLNVAPNYTVNRVMNTADFDNGVFWLFVDPPPSLLWLAVVGLAVAGLGYIVILVEMVSRRPKRRVSQAPLSLQSPSKSDVTRTASATGTADKIAKRVASSAKLVITFARTDSAARQLAVSTSWGIKWGT